jgi:membrane-associated phospholipid phosphatase
MYFCPMQRVILLVAFLCTLTSSTYAQPDSLSWEARITYDANAINSTGLRSASGIASDALVPLSVGVPVTLYVIGALGALQSPEDNRYMAESGLQVAVTMGVTYAVTLGLKTLIDRQRPYQAYPGTIINYRDDHDGSFPSGHSAGSAALATSLSLRYPHWYVIAPSVAYALFTGFSRLNLGMHYLSDVLSGYALGVGVAILVNALNADLFRIADGVLPDRTVESPLPMGVFNRDATTLFAISLPL